MAGLMSLGDTPALGGAFGEAQKPTMKQTEAPASKNSLERKINELYWREQNGEITPEQASQEWAKARSEATPAETEQYNKGLERYLKGPAK